MALLTVTAAEVTAATTGVAKVIAQLGATIAAGQVVYLAITTGTVSGVSTTAGKWYKAVTSSAEASGVGTTVGIALADGVDTQWIAVATAGPVTLESSTDIMVVGTHYYVVSTTGRIGERTTDVGAGGYVTDLGYATTTRILTLNVAVTGLTSVA